MEIYFILIILLGIAYGFYFLLTEGKPIQKRKFRPTKQIIDEFNKRYKEGFYDVPK